MLSCFLIIMVLAFCFSPPKSCMRRHFSSPEAHPVLPHRYRFLILRPLLMSRFCTSAYPFHMLYNSVASWRRIGDSLHGGIIWLDSRIYKWAREEEQPSGSPAFRPPVVLFMHADCMGLIDFCSCCQCMEGIVVNTNFLQL